MTTDAELDEKLARVRRRVEARGTAVRERLAAIGALHLAEAAREVFGAKLVYLRVGDHEQGTAQPESHPYNLDLRPTKLHAKTRGRTTA